MTDAAVRTVVPKLSIRTKLKGVSLIYAIDLRKVASELTGKANLNALFGWCQKQGVGLDGFSLGLRPGGQQATLWIDGPRKTGVILRNGAAVARVEGGAVSDSAWAEWLRLVPASANDAWGGVAAAPASVPPKAKVKATVKQPAFVARVDLELSSRAQVKALTPTSRAQLTAAAGELSGKKGLEALLRWCDEEAQGLAHVTVMSGKTARYEAWLTSALEDGVFFDAGKKRLNGLAVSQGEVHASASAREGEVADLAAAMKRLKARPAPKWKG